MKQETYDVAVLGSGIAGSTLAAIRAPAPVPPSPRNCATFSASVGASDIMEL